jgi:hypothetical protein
MMATQIANRRSRRAQGCIEKKRQRVIAKASQRQPRLEDYGPGSLAGPNRIGLAAIFCSSDCVVVERALRSARPFISTWAVVDSGSSDAVKDTIVRVFDGIPGKLVHRPWTDSFSDARNAAMDLGREAGADLALFLDQDDYVVPREMILEGQSFRLPPLPPLTAPVSAVEYVANDGWRFYRAAFARLDVPLRWRGRVHEWLELDGRECVVEGRRDYAAIYGRDARDRGDYAERERRWLDLLRLDLADEPGNPITLHHIAGTHVRLGDWSIALTAIDDALSAEDGNADRRSLLHRWWAEATENLR